ncbi:dolichyl-phosphate beta-glucosyltransferase-like isoform X2 [Peromyscus maniculatus bairdii]|uniref:dolichyl-phosphate beta-glucosyltransferase-like isoform X2 n=1 Tax=Peromyscus maniculatus bairdii TaxID=230844 RepID=UPI003FD4001E
MLVQNRGKGGTVRMGIISSPGEKILMADADGATKFPDVEKLEKGLSDLQPWPDQKTIACGYQAHLEKESIAQVKLSRAAMDSSLLTFNPLLQTHAHLTRNDFLCLL